jgi:class 3 adenylate cyclase
LEGFVRTVPDDQIVRALVKTIGDAVMASFHEPLSAIRAALDMLTQIRNFNDSAGEELIMLKIGAHVGPCLAVTLNGRLDYFGQTVTWRPAFKVWHGRMRFV